MSGRMKTIVFVDPRRIAPADEPIPIVDSTGALARITATHCGVRNRKSSYSQSRLRRKPAASWPLPLRPACQGVPAVASGSVWTLRWTPVASAD